MCEQSDFKKKRHIAAKRWIWRITILGKQKSIKEKHLTALKTLLNLFIRLLSTFCKLLIHSKMNSKKFKALNAMEKQT